MTKPKVSVVIPNFNYGRYLGDALMSIISQGFGDWEAIVIDNLSSDNSELVAKGFQDPRIKFVQFANGGSIARARNHGISIAQGDLVAFLDSDDKWEPQKLEEQLQIMNAGADLSYHSLRRFGNARGVFRAWSLSRKQPLEHLLAEGNPITTSSAMMRIELAKALGGFPEGNELLAAEDYALWLRVAHSGFKIVKCPGILGSYRVHPSTTGKVDAPKAAELAALPFVNGVSQRVRRMHSGFLAYGRGVRCESQGKNKEARQDFLIAIRFGAYRFAWRAAARLLRLLFLRS